MLNYKHLEVQLARASTLPILPHVATQLLNIPDSPTVSPKDYERLIIQDTAMTAKVLRTANSPLFGGGGRITTLQRAMALLGFDTVRSICIMVSLQSSSATKALGVHFSTAAFWQHSITVACISKVIATVKHYPKPEEAFLAGLLHDIGKLAIAMFLPSESREITIRARSENMADFEAERLVLGTITHEQIGAEVAIRWGLPDLYLSAIEHHHTPIATDPQDLSCFVHVANILSYQHGLGFGIQGAIHTLDPMVQVLLGLEQAQYDMIGEKVESEVKKVIQGLCSAQAA